MSKPQGYVVTSSPGTGAIIPLNFNGLPQISLQATVSGAITYTIQSTLDNVWTDTTINWVNHAIMASQTTTQQGNYAFLPAAVRLLTSAGSGSVEFRVIQAGLAGN